MSARDFTACRSSVSEHVGPVREAGQPHGYRGLFPQGGRSTVAQARLSMRRIREILRLQAEGYSEREIARSVGCARSSVQICLWRAERAGISWPVPADIDDAGLDARLYPRRPGVEVQPPPDFEWIARELRRKHVTRRQLWREYLAQHPEGLKYTAFCVKFRQWRRSRGVTLSLTHSPGDRLFVDYASFLHRPDHRHGAEGMAVYRRLALQRTAVRGSHPHAELAGLARRPCAGAGGLWRWPARHRSRQLHDGGEESPSLRPRVQSRVRRICRTLFRGRAAGTRAAPPGQGGRGECGTDRRATRVGSIARSAVLLARGVEHGDH